MKKILLLLFLFPLVCFAQRVKPIVGSFILINAETNRSIRTLTNGSVINLDIDGSKLNIKANVYPKTLTKVNFVLTGPQTRSYADTNDPFSSFGDVNGNYNEWTPAVGNYTLKATPVYAGTAGTTRTISFTVKRNSQTGDPAPTVTVNQASSQSDPASNFPILFTATFSEPVTGFRANDVILAGTAGPGSVVVSGGPRVYTLSVSKIKASGTVAVRIPAGAAIDSAGNPNTKSTSTDNTVTYKYTITPPADPVPTVTVNQANNQPDPASGSQVLFTARFSEAVTGFASNDVLLSGTAGATAAVVSGGPSVYTITVSGMTKSGTIIVNLPAGAANDSGGNPNTKSTSTDNTVTHNSTPPPNPAPTVTVNQASNQSDPASASPVLFTATFSESVTGFAPNDVLLSGTAGATTAVVTGGPGVYTISVSGMTKSGTIIVNLPAGAANDSQGTPNTKSTSTDNTVTYNISTPDPAPTVTVNQASNQSDPASASPVLFTATFSESVTGFASNDVLLSGTAGATIAIITGGPSVYTISVSGMTKTGTIIVNVPAGAANDSGGHPNTKSTSTDNAVTYNISTPDPAPTVTVNQAGNQSDPASSSPVLFTATFSEAVTGFASNDVVLSGTAGATIGVVTGGPSVYTISVSGMPKSGTVIVNLPAGAANDSGGNPNTNSTSTDNTVTYNITVNPPIAGGYYASPTGTGNGTYASPFRIADFWKVAKAGDTLNLMDGHYTGTSSMITPPQNLSGTATSRITIRAVNDGKADIDGERTNSPCKLEYNNYFQLEGFNVHHSPLQSSVITIVNSNNNIFKRIIGWETSDGNVNIWNLRASSNNLIEDCAGWGQARKIFGATQRADNNIFRRCFGRWEGSIVLGPKKVFTLSYNSYNNMAENCIGTWDALKMPQTYTLRNYDYTINTDENNGSPTQYSNYQVHQPGGIFGNDGFDLGPTVPSDIANIKALGCIAYLKQNQRYHNSPNRGNAAPYSFSLKGTEMRDCISFIEPGANHSYIQNVNLEGTGGSSTLNPVTNLTRVGGKQDSWTIDASWNVTRALSGPDCSVVKANGGTIINPTNPSGQGAVIEKRYVNGVLTNESLWPWPMNQRIIDAMIQGGYTPVDITKEVFGLCGNTPPSQPAVDIVAVAKQWLVASPADRSSLEATLDSWQGNIDSVIQKVKPVPTATQKGQVFYQSFSNPVFQQRWPSHQFHMYVPSHYTATKPIGLMIWLHGGGSWSSGDIDHLAQYDMDNEQVTGRSYARTETDNSNYILVAPIAPFGSKIPHPQHASRWDVPDADQYLMDIITEIAARYNIDYNRVVVAGFSMGGIGAYHQALRLNDRLSAVMASAGSWKLGTWDGLKNMPMYLIHGVTDAYYSSSGCRPHNTAIEYARLAHTALYRASTIHRLYEYPGGHSWDGSGELYWKNFISGQTGWVTDKVRNPYRTNVTAVNPWRSYDTGNNFGVSWTEKPSPHTMWVSIKQTGTGTIPYDYARESGTGGCSSSSDFNNWSLTLTTMNMPGGKAEANITGPNQIVVTSTNVTKMSLWLHPNMVNFNNPVQVTVNGTTKSYSLKASLLTALKSYERRWDWGMIYHAEIDIN